MVFGLNKISWALRRHPLLYITRFRLLSKNSTIKKLDDDYYNIENNKATIPSLFYEVNEIIFKEGKPNSDLDKAISIALWLKKNIKGGFFILARFLGPSLEHWCFEKEQKF